MTFCLCKSERYHYGRPTLTFRKYMFCTRYLTSLHPPLFPFVVVVSFSFFLSLFRFLYVRVYMSISFCVWSLCLHVYTYIYIYVYTHTACLYICIYICIHTHTHIYIYVIKRLRHIAFSGLVVRFCPFSVNNSLCVYTPGASSWHTYSCMYTEIVRL